jgi:hypothetical protein
MPNRTPFLVAVIVIAAGLCAALAFDSVYDISIRMRPSELSTPPIGAAEARGTSRRPALPLRLVDSGGVGVPLSGEWGSDYSHDLRVFREAILEKPPYVDAAVFDRIELQWRAYVERMLSYGNNAIAVPLLLELIDFDRVTPSVGTAGVIYDANSPFRARHAAVRRHFAPLFDWTRRRGMQVFLTTDMLALTPPLAEQLRRLAPDKSAAGINTTDPVVWDIYRAGLEELFEDLPVDGLVIRFGEGGNLYNTGGWPYRSEMAIRSVVSLRAMLHGLLPAFEAHHKTLVLRSWTVGVGQLGRLHVDPRMYDTALGDIDSPALVVSTKYTAGDFFSYLPLNPTLLAGRHRRLIELQAKPEFEGFGAFPNFVAEEHARALRALRSANPQISGIYLLTQFGGPLRAGPQTLYPLHGFWLWTDANVFVDSQLALDPGADVGDLTRRWAQINFGDHPQVLDAVVNVLSGSREAVLKGYYIRSFAERQVRVPGLELPPLMWIFEWDMVGGWHSLLSLVYRTSRDDVGISIAEGHSAAATIRRMRVQLQTAFAGGGAPACGALCMDALRSLEYEETLFDALAAWRQAFLSYYRWLDTGDAEAWTKWRDGRERFARTAARHVSRFGHDLDFPAFDLGSASQAVSIAERGGWERFVAGGVLIGMLALVKIGGSVGRRSDAPARFARLVRFSRLTRTAATSAWRLRSEPVDQASAMAVTLLALLLVGLLAGTFTGFTTVWTGAGVPVIVGIVALAFAGTTRRSDAGEECGRLLAASVGPLLSGVTLLFALMAYVGPLGFWYFFWTSSSFRIALLTLVLAVPLWTVYVVVEARREDGWHGHARGMLVASGAGLLGLTTLLPDWVDVLRSLDQPLNFAPATETMLFALRTYAGVSLDISRQSYVIGALLLASGYAIWLRSRLRTASKSVSTPDAGA